MKNVLNLYGVQGEPFGKYTPMAKCEMLIINPEAEKQFELNAEYRVTFEKIKEKQTISTDEIGKLEDVLGL